MAKLKKSMIEVTVCYALPETQTVLPVSVADGSTVATALQLSGIFSSYPEIDMTTQALGIFGRKVTLTTLIKPGDRIEIYRPLLIDPKKARSLRADRAAKEQRKLKQQYYIKQKETQKQK